MKNYYLAFDIGASSGRTILGEIADNKIKITEVSRFTNNFTKVRGHFHWNVYNIFEELQNGIKAFTKQFNSSSLIALRSVGIDTWGVDFGLLDKSGNILTLPYCYRDHITDGIIEDFFKNVLSAGKLYNITGIQFLKFNSLFQLYALKKKNKILLENAGTMLFMPDLLNYLFTGVKSTEYSIASTSQILNATAKNWSADLFKAIKVSPDIFTDIVQPGKIVGNILPDVAESLNIKPVPVVAVAEHDTGSAVAAVPAKGDNWAYLSSGTWSLMGIELDKPIISEKSLQYAFTNEGGIEGTIRFLKNISGLWLFEQCKRRTELSYDELIKMAEEAKPFQYFLNPDDPSFDNPVNMVDAIKEYCRKTNQKIPETIGEIVRAIFESLAMKYLSTMEMLKELSPKSIEVLHIIGGGCRNEMLCQFTANALGMPVLAGPAEATAIGNIMVQALATKRVSSIAEIRQIVADSTDIIRYNPKETETWTKAYPRFLEITSNKIN